MIWKSEGAWPGTTICIAASRRTSCPGRLKAGEKLPSKRTLATHLNTAVVTVENAYAQLEAEGYLNAREKRGYFVNPGGDRTS